MQTIFGPDFFSANRVKLWQAHASDAPIVIAGNGSMQRGSDEPAVFLQDSNFWYLTGLNVPDLVLVIDNHGSYIIAPTLSFVRQAFDGAHYANEFASRSGITDVLDEKTGWQRVATELQTHHAVATLESPPAFLRRHGLHTLPFRRRLIAKLKRLDPGLAIADLRPLLAKFRAVKQPEELAALQQAIDITSSTLKQITHSQQFRDARYEYELEAELGYHFRKAGADGHAFAPIVGAGAHSTTLHHIANNGPIAPDDLIVLDVGAAVEHYAADVTRTVSRQPLTARTAEVFGAVEAVQDFALNLIKPGMLLGSYEQAVEQYMGTQLQQLGLITDPTHENIRHYFPHATSHFLGLDTHDVGDYRQPLTENMVITCEPGIYIPEEAIGVRIEDDVLLTATGHKVLSSACPHRLTPVQ